MAREKDGKIRRTTAVWFAGFYRFQKATSEAGKTDFDCRPPDIAFECTSIYRDPLPVPDVCTALLLLHLSSRCPFPRWSEMMEVRKEKL